MVPEPSQGAQIAEAVNALFELSRIVCRSLRPKPGSLVEWNFEQGHREKLYAFLASWSFEQGQGLTGPRR